MIRTASCRCGQLSAQCEGEPLRVSVCHCHACQQRSGSPFGAQARFAEDKVTISGKSKKWVRRTDAGNLTHYHFCPVCGSTVWYQGGPIANAIAIPIGLFCDADFPPPQYSVWEARQHSWAKIDAEVEHYD